MCNLNQEFDSIKCNFIVMPTIPNIYYIPDACHNIKLARNALGTFGSFKDSEDNLIEWKYIDKLYKIQIELGFKQGNKVSSAHVN